VAKLGDAVAFQTTGECPHCGRDIGLVAGEDGDVLRYHRDDGAPCPGRGMKPKGENANVEES
jgi:hypothetical protein